MAARYLGGGTRIALFIRAAAVIDVLVQAKQASRANKTSAAGCPAADEMAPWDPGSDDLEVRHHPGVLVLQLVAVNHVEAILVDGGIEADQDFHGFAVLQEDGVLP